MQPRDEIFIQTLVADNFDQMINVIPQLLKGTIIKELRENTFEVEIAYPRGKKFEVLPRQKIIKSRDEAEKKLCSVIALGERNQLRELVKGNTDFLPSYLTDKGVHYSANPLRYGEPGVVFCAQSNTWNASENAQKIMQTIGAIWQDIRSLQAILFVLGYSNDYTKKLIGKYIILELWSLYVKLKDLRKHDADYRCDLHKKLEIDIKNLERELNLQLMNERLNKRLTLQVIRNKIRGHRDIDFALSDTVDVWQKITRYNLYRYIKVFESHIRELLANYNIEPSLYFGTEESNTLKPEDVQWPEDNPYQPFDEMI